MKFLKKSVGLRLWRRRLLLSAGRAGKGNETWRI